MKKSITITIPEPCHEDWAKMTPTEKGKFCSVCTKEVFDFTKSTDEELIKSLEAGKNLCGRFKSSQLDREVKLERKSGKGLLPYAASLLIPIGLMGSSEAFAQGGPMVKDNEFKSLRIGSNPVKSIVTITGFVTDANNIPVANAEVFVLETGKSVRTAPDGSYILVCTSGSTIFSTKGELKSKTLVLGTKDAVIDFRLEALPTTTSVVGTAVGLIVSKSVPVSNEQALKNKLTNPDIEETTDQQKNEKTAKVIISGTVFDEQGLPFPGVNVRIKETNFIIPTDLEGRYEITTEPNNTLQFYSLGYVSKEITTSNISTNIDISLIGGIQGRVKVHRGKKGSQVRIATERNSRKKSRLDKKAARLESKKAKLNSKDDDSCDPAGLKPKNKK